METKTKLRVNACTPFLISRQHFSTSSLLTELFKPWLARSKNTTNSLKTWAYGEVKAFKAGTPGVFHNSHITFVLLIHLCLSSLCCNRLIWLFFPSAPALWNAPLWSNLICMAQLGGTRTAICWRVYSSLGCYEEETFRRSLDFMGCGSTRQQCLGKERQGKMRY